MNEFNGYTNWQTLVAALNVYEKNEEWTKIAEAELELCEGKQDIAIMLLGYDMKTFYNRMISYVPYKNKAVGCFLNKTLSNANWKEIAKEVIDAVVKSTKEEEEAE